MMKINLEGRLYLGTGTEIMVSKADYLAMVGPARGPKRNSPEHVEQAKLFETLRNPIVLLKFPELGFIYSSQSGSVWANKAARGKAKAAGMLPGVPDVFVPMRGRNTWGFIVHIGLYIEMKWGDNTLSDVQKKFRVFAEAHGYCYRVCYSASEALEAIEEYLGIKIK